MTTKTRCIVLWIVLLLPHCSKDENSDQASQGDSSEQQGLLNQPWKGVQTSKNLSEDTQLTQATISLNLKTDHTFDLTYNQTPGGYVKGTFYDSYDKIVFVIDKSTMSIFGGAGTTRTMQFERMGDKLLLTDDKLEFILLATKEEKEAPQEETKKLLTHWVCQKDQLSFKLELSEDQTFDLRIVQNNSSETFHTSGKLQDVTDSSAQLSFRDNQGMNTLMKLRLISKKALGAEVFYGYSTNVTYSLKCY